MYIRSSNEYACTKIDIGEREFWDKEKLADFKSEANVKIPLDIYDLIATIIGSKYVNQVTCLDIVISLTNKLKSCYTSCAYR